MSRRKLSLFAAIATIACLPAASAHAVVLTVYGTTDVTDSGLLSDVITPGFAAFDPADSFTYKAEGTGAALNDAKVAANHVDAVLVHSASSEAAWVNLGFSAEPLGRAIFFNDYVIVGPKTDPAGVLANFPHDAVGAYQAIGAAGIAGHATFVSRNDASGTNTAEQAIWAQTAPGTPPKTVISAGHDVPAVTDGGAIPAWYTETGLGQGDNLDATNNCVNTAGGDPGFPNGGCYTMVDRGTYLKEQSLGHTNNLEIVSQNNSPTALGGASELTNPFHAYIVSTSTNKAVAEKFLNYLTSPGFQQALLNYPGNGQVSVFPDAFPEVTASSIPTHAAAGATVPITATLAYAPPIPTGIAGMPVQLQESPTGAAGSFTNVGAPQTTDATGSVTFSPAMPDTTTVFRLHTDRFISTALASIFSANDTAQLGAQSGLVNLDPGPPAPPPPTTTTTVTAPAPPPAPTTPAPVSHTFSFTKLLGASTGSLRLSLAFPGAGKVTVTLSTRVKGRKVTFAKSISKTLTRAGTLSETIKPSAAAKLGLKHHHRLTVTITVTFSPKGGTRHTQTTTVSVG